MPPGSQKRKRSVRPSSDDNPTPRPSPYRPDKAALSAEPSQQSDVSGTDGAANTTDGGPRIDSGMATQEDPPELQPTVSFSRPFWTYVTDDVLSAWTESGTQTLATNLSGADEMQIGQAMQELLWSGLSGRLSGQQAGLALRDIIRSHAHSEAEPEALFLNALSLLDDKHHNNPHLRPLAAAAGVDGQIMRQELDIPLLQALNLVRSTFDKMRTRKTTNALYRQANFNLLREESEGYAKLITEYFNTAQDASNRRDDDLYMAEDAFQRVKALVGAFDLDVGRVLDITLDVSANLLVKAYPFLMKFYRASSWWPTEKLLDGIEWEDQGFGPLPTWALPGSGMSTSSDEDKLRLGAVREARDIQFWSRARAVGIEAFSEIGARRIVNFDAVLPMLDTEIPPEVDSRGKETNPNNRLRSNENRKYMRDTRTLPPPGNYDAAQLLGFKLRFYASDARDANDVLPDNVIFLAALLIKIGFISLRDLYPHLHPPDDAMAQEKARLEKEKAEKEAKERPGAGANALAMAAALTDDTIPIPRLARTDKERSGGTTPAPDKKEEPAPRIPPPQNQKIMLLKALLLIGALPEAVHILGRFPWLVDADTSMPQYLHRIAKHMLSKVAQTTRPLNGRVGLQDPCEQLADLSPMPDSRLKFVTRPIQKKSTRWLHIDGFDEQGQEYRHYYADWSDNVPICQNVDDVFTLCDTFLGYLGVKVGQDAALYGTLLQIAKYSLAEDKTASNRTRWLELMKRTLVPSLSLSKHNPQLAHDLYDLLQHFPTSMRYNIYAEWFTGRTSRMADMRSAFARNKAEVRDVLRRVSNDNGKKQSRALAKIAISSPGIVMMEMINQLESYSNMIPSLVECTRYFTRLAYDVLTWCLISSLSGQGRDRMQADGMLTSAWLQALSQFVASLFTRYGHLNASPVLQYLASELQVGNSTDLEMFEQLLVEMAGIRSDVEFNDYQVLAMAGGENLQSHILQQLSDTRHAKKAPAKRLMKALADPGLVGQILIAIAQERQMYAQHESSKYMPLKVLGNNLDKIQAVFAQYLEVLHFNLSPVEFSQHVPDAISLIRYFGIHPGIALTIDRAAIRHRMAGIDATAKKPEEHEDKKKTRSQADVQLSNTDVAMQDAVSKEFIDDKEGSGTASADNNEKEAQGLSSEEPDVPLSGASPWHPVLESLAQHLPEVVPNLPSRVSLSFYVTFWTLTYQDISVPNEVYLKEQTKVKKAIQEIENDRSDVSAVVARERERKKKALLETQIKLLDEPKHQMSIHLATKWRLLKVERFHWFPKSTATTAKAIKDELDSKHMGLLQECFLPRATMSSLDARVSFQMLKILHDSGTTGFSLMHLLFHLFKRQQLTALMFQYTAVEAQHFGRFLNEIMKLLHWWHADKANYDKEALGDGKLPGFVKKFDANGEPKSILEFEEFRRMLHNFHAFLNGALQSCFESGEYMHIRNGIIVLKAVHQVFPAVKFMGLNMVAQVKKLSESDPRQDLKLAAMSLLGPLKNREKHWVLPQAFRAAKEKDPKPAGSAPSAQNETHQAGGNTPKLNGGAAEYKPNVAVLANGSGHRASLAGPEDGEIEDEKQAAESRKSQPTQVGSEAVEMKPTVGKENDSSSSKAVKLRDQAALANELRPPEGRSSAAAASRQTTSASDLPSRPSSTQHTSSRPPPSDLPSKPEQGPGSRMPPMNKTGFRPNNRTEDRFGRLERPNEVRQPAREESPSGRTRARSPVGGPGRPQWRDERTYDRPPFESRPSRDESWGSSRRDPAAHHPRPVREPFDRSNNSGRQTGEHATIERSMPSGSVAVVPENLPISHPSSIGPPDTQAQRQPLASTTHVNPDRMALINDVNTGVSPHGRRDDVSQGRDQRQERDGRPDERMQQSSAFGARSDPRPNGRGPIDIQRDTVMHPDAQADLTPTGPKRGRLSRDVGPPQESSYGRLNGPSDAPSGPRQHNGPAARNGRSAGAQSPAGHSRPNDAPGTANYVRTTDGPITPRGGPSRQPSSSALNQERVTPISSAPATSATEGGPAVHPSRAAQLGQPPSIQTNFSTAGDGRNNSAASPAGPPAGPRGPARGPSGTPTGNSPTTNNFPPAGPASALQRNNRQRANINAALSGGPNGQGISFRGASSRASFDASHSPADSRAAVPTVASSMNPPQSRPPPDSRAFAEDVPDKQSDMRPDLFQEKASRNDTGSVRRRGDDRSYGSRDASRERRQDNLDQTFRGPLGPPLTEENRVSRGPPRDVRAPSDGPLNQRRGPPRTDEPSFRRPPTHTPASFAGPPDWDRSNDSRPMRREGADDGRRGGRMGGAGRPDDFRGPPRREEDRRDGAGRGHPRADIGPPPPDGRKRRHEEAPFDPTKRRRGGR